MAHSPIFRHSLSDPSGSSGEPTSLGASGETGSRVGDAFSRRVNYLVAQAGGGLTQELAIDLVLHELVQEARTITGADAAAIALKRDGGIVCRATSGESAPALGSHLTRDSGLSAACVRSLEWQRCDDSEADFRVSAELCRQLGVRSILVVPILKDGDLLGAIEVFSPRPSAFGNAELAALQRLSSDIVAGLDQVEARPISETVSPPAVENIEATPHEPDDVSVPLPLVKAPAPASDVWTSALLAAVVALALVLGWVVGRAGRRGVPSSADQGRIAARDASASSAPKPDAAPAHSQGSASSGAASDLVVYKDGKVVFALPQPAPTSHSATPVVPAAQQDRVATLSGPVRVSQQIAMGYVVTRVEPDYPKAAREARVQGEVVLAVRVGADGRVQSVNVLQGAPQLTESAMQAVSLWRFRPFLHNGQPAEFETEVTVIFRLP